MNVNTKENRVFYLASPVRDLFNFLRTYIFPIYFSTHSSVYHNVKGRLLKEIFGNMKSEMNLYITLSSYFRALPFGILHRFDFAHELSHL